MFVETITAPAEEWESWTERLRMLSDPPPALVASIAWNAGEGRVSSVNVWDSAGAVADFFLERVQPILGADGAPTMTPTRHGEAVAVYLRHG
jgi:hypothetical protein